MGDFLPVFAKLAMWILGMVIADDKQDAEGKAMHVKLAEHLRLRGLKDVKSRFESESQLAAGDAEWERRQQAERGEQ